MNTKPEHPFYICVYVYIYIIYIYRYIKAQRHQQSHYFVDSYVKINFTGCDLKEALIL